MAAKVYQYGSPLKTVVEGEAKNQILLQARFWNNLVEIDREFARRYRDLINNADDKIAALTGELTARKEEIEALRKSIKERRQASRAGKAPATEIKARIAQLVAENKPLIEEIKAYRAKIKVELKPKTHDLEAERRGEVKKLRQRYAAEGLYWGNYNAVLNSFDTARSRAMQSGAELRFHRFDGTGRWTCQIQGGMSIEEAFEGGSNSFQIDRIDPAAWDDSSTTRGERKRLCRTSARVRINSDAARKPVWLEIPIVMHRPIPADARIQLVSVNTKKIANRIQWFLNVTVVEGDEERGELSGDVVALDVGWRKKPDGCVRVAFWADGSGGMGEVKLDPWAIAADRQVQSLQSTRDGNFNAARERVAKWMASRKNAEGSTAIPEWFLERTATLSQWRSQARLAALVSHWRGNRFPGDDDIFAISELWRKQDKHLWTWQANLRDKTQKRRLEHYRVFAAQLAAKYDVAVFDQFDLRGPGRKKSPEEGVDSESRLRHIKTLAGVSVLRGEIKRAFDSAGKLFVKKQFGATEDCPFCGATKNGEPNVDMHLRCPNCGKIFDRDHAKAKYLLERWFAAS